MEWKRAEQIKQNVKEHLDDLTAFYDEQICKLEDRNMELGDKIIDLEKKNRKLREQNLLFTNQIAGLEEIIKKEQP